MKPLKTIALATAIALTGVFSIGNATAQEPVKNEFRLFYGTAAPGGTPSIRFARSFSNALSSGTSVYDQTKTASMGMVGLAYRYHFDRLAVGIDLGISPEKVEYFKGKNKLNDLTENKMRYLAMPTVEFTYYQNDLVKLYGGAGAGVMVEHSKAKKGDANKKGRNETQFAYQVTPIGVRVGNDLVGGFVEAGYGHKGLLTAGVTLSF